MSSLRSWKEVPMGGVAYRLSTDVKTGDWRAMKPVIDQNKCTKCMICWLFCPDMSI
ncbi:MAG: 4Fe-4S binding protein, partial [Desulfurococcaceae archaeon]